VLIILDNYVGHGGLLLGRTEYHRIALLAILWTTSWFEFKHEPVPTIFGLATTKQMSRRLLLSNLANKHRQTWSTEVIEGSDLPKSRRILEATKS